MDSVEDVVRRIGSVHSAIGASLDGFGGILRCETCRAESPLRRGDAGRYTAKGWPRCCGHTMRWWTQHQIDAGEMPA